MGVCVSVGVCERDKAPPTAHCEKEGERIYWSDDVGPTFNGSVCMDLMTSDRRLMVQFVWTL